MTSWQAEWLESAARAQRELWRGVEAQHRVATMRLVDNIAEQELLEQLLEASKPPVPPSARGAHYLLFTPFRYVSPLASRFRQPDKPGAWYGADEPQTVAAELAYWRWRFVADSEGLQSEQVITEHTFFQARFDGLELDISCAPWNECRDQWRAPRDYSHCHSLAEFVRQSATAVQSIRYESARREGARCQVVFDVATLCIPNLHVQQTWTCKTTRDVVLMRHDGESLEFRSVELA